MVEVVHLLLVEVIVFVTGTSVLHMVHVEYGTLVVSVLQVVPRTTESDLSVFVLTSGAVMTVELLPVRVEVIVLLYVTGVVTVFDFVNVSVWLMVSTLTLVERWVLTSVVELVLGLTMIVVVV